MLPVIVTHGSSEVSRPCDPGWTLKRKEYTHTIGTDLKFACVIKVVNSGTATRDIPVYLDMLTHVGTESAQIT
jgi:hypothetical protein